MEENIRDRVKRLCRDNGITAAQLERLLGFGNGYISKMDKSVPSTVKVQKIAEYFQVPVSYILRGGEVFEPREDTGYYFDKRTAAVAQELYENRALSLLFDEARDAKPEDLLLTYNVLKALKDRERRGE